MSIHWMNRVWDLSQHKGSYLLAMLAISDNANDYGVAWPGYPLIARKTRLSTRTIPRLVEHLVASSELAVHAGGGGRRDTNLYVLLLGREADEVAKIMEILKQKHVNLSSLKAGQFVMLDKLSWKKPANKHDTAMSSDPSMNHGKSMDGWMDGDLICGFLKDLPGYNAAGLKTDRAAIAPHVQAYDLEALQYLWSDCEAEAQDNPIGLFLYRAKLGMQSPRYAEMCTRRRDEEERQRLLAERNAGGAADESPAPIVLTPAPVAAASAPIVVDPSATQPIAGVSTRMTPMQVWQAAQGELQMQMTRATYDTWVKQTSLVAVNGTWKIAVPNSYIKEWWETRLLVTLKRILHGIVGQPCEPEFVVYQRGEA